MLISPLLSLEGEIHYKSAVAIIEKRTRRYGDNVDTDKGVTERGIFWTGLENEENTTSKPPSGKPWSHVVNTESFLKAEH